MSRWAQVRGFVVLLALGCVWLVGQGATALPVSLFVVHCEPTRATPEMWIALTRLVELANEYRTPLSIDFTAQWAAMILEDEDKLAALESWLAAGHEIGCHHHAYWGTQRRASTWDGYTNTPLSQIAASDQALYRGTMEDFMGLLNALPGERRSGCLGASEPGDEADHPCQIVYVTEGHALEDAVSQPTRVNRSSCSVLEIRHALITSQKRGALQASYLAAEDDVFFGVVGHVYNYADFPQLFKEWFSFLFSLDEAGAFRETVSMALQAWEAAH